MRVGFIITCFNREAYWPYLQRIISGYSAIQPVLVYCYNGLCREHPCDVRLENDGQSPGDFRLTLAGYRRLTEVAAVGRPFRFIKLSVDTWPCDEAAVVEIFNRMEACQACYAGNYWHHNVEGSLATDIFFADTRFGNVFDELAVRGHRHDFEISMARAVASAGRPYLVPERHPVHGENRWKCDKLKWTMSHDLAANIDYARQALGW